MQMCAVPGLACKSCVTGYQSHLAPQRWSGKVTCMVTVIVIQTMIQTTLYYEASSSLFGVLCVPILSHRCTVQCTVYSVLYTVQYWTLMLESKVLHLLPFQTVHSQTEHSLLIQILFSRLCTTELFIGDYVLQNWAFLSTLCTSERLKSLLWIFIKTLYLRTFSSSLCTPKAMYSRTSLLSRF